MLCACGRSVGGGVRWEAGGAGASYPASLARARFGPRENPLPSRYIGKMKAVGSNVPRKEGLARATGAAVFADDLRFPGMLHGRTVRSSVARGRLTGHTLGFDPAGFTVVDHRDIPGENVIALIERDQP